MHFLQIHDFPASCCGTCASNSCLISLFTHQQGVLLSTAHKLSFWHKGHWLVLMSGIGIIFPLFYYP
ncbi:hypothetical protein A3Q33_08525 [Colwellia sp. PAMC 21821]|nr:hypothetical protein A3Q33_08525 [Colwellia sp. PAMC 21821]